MPFIKTPSCSLSTFIDLLLLQGLTIERRSNHHSRICVNNANWRICVVATPHRGEGRESNNVDTAKAVVVITVKYWKGRPVRLHSVHHTQLTVGQTDQPICTPSPPPPAPLGSDVLQFAILSPILHKSHWLNRGPFGTVAMYVVIILFIMASQSYNLKQLHVFCISRVNSLCWRNWLKRKLLFTL